MSEQDHSVETGISLLFIYHYFCFPELLVHFFCLTILPLRLILNIETEPIFLTRLQGREVTINAEAFLVKNHYFSHLHIMFSICIQYSSAF